MGPLNGAVYAAVRRTVLAVPELLHAAQQAAGFGYSAQAGFIEILARLIAVPRILVEGAKTSATGQDPLITCFLVSVTCFLRIVSAA